MIQLGIGEKLELNSKESDVNYEFKENTFKVLYNEKSTR